jgi:dimethylglycine catabolism A
MQAPKPKARSNACQQSVCVTMHRATPVTPVTMWKPPERIKHEVTCGPWPCAVQAGEARLFQPVSLGPLALERRTWVPAMVPWRASDDGLVTNDVVDWYARLARGKPGALVIEATGIRDIPSGPLLRIGHDRYIPGLTRLTEAVNKASEGHTRLLIQLIDFLAIKRRPSREQYLQRFLRINERHRRALHQLHGGVIDMDEDSARTQLLALNDATLAKVLTAREFEAMSHGFRERVTDEDVPHIRELPRALPTLFADAAVRAQHAGFDGIELHYAHAYTMASFLSRLNTRKDGFGGPREARVQLPLRVFQAVRDAVGKDFCCGCRMLSEDCVEDGSDVADATYFASAFARAGMDFLSFSRGGKFEDAKQPKPGWAAYPYTGPSGFECMPTAIADDFGPFGRNVEPAAKIRKALRQQGLSTPVVVAGGIHDFSMAERVLREDKADVVGAARQSLADPDWFEKVRLGRAHEVRLCTYTNYCEGLDQKHKQVTCRLWDRENLDAADVTLTRDGKRRLVPPEWSR